MTRKTATAMYIMLRGDVTEAQRQAIGAALQLPGPASRAQVRAYLQKLIDIHLASLTLAVVQVEAPRLALGGR